MAEQYKALTYVNLPFLDGNGRLYPPGQSIPRDAIEESVRLAVETINDDNAEIQSADDQIAYMIEQGALSEDPDADLHPDHRPVTPGQPTVTGLVEQAQALVTQLQESHEEIPPELQALADSKELRATGDGGSGGDANA